MNSFRQAWWQLLPRRRRRFWRYVSPTRRGAGVVALALLVLMVYGYWYLSNDARIRRHAKEYLHNLTGGRVEIGAAHFSLFGGIEIRNVRLFVPGPPSPEPFLKARTVLLRYSPWTLLSTWQLGPAEVICQEPVVTLERDVQSGEYSFQRFLDRYQHGGGEGQAKLAGLLPSIRVRQGRLKWVDVDNGLRQPFDEMPVTLSMTSDAGGYRIVFEEQGQGSQPVIRGQFTLNPVTGEIKLISGSAPIPNLDKALPGKYRQWRQRYGITGEVRLLSTKPAGGGEMEWELADVSLKLPTVEGGLEMAHVSGVLAFDEDGVSIRDVTGQVPQAGEGRFQVSGRYHGYEADGAFDLRVKAKSLTLPDKWQATGSLADWLRQLTEQVELSGRGDLSVRIQRTPEGKIIFDGTLQPQGMSVSFLQAPYRLDDVRGSVAFWSDHVELRQLTGSHEKGQFLIDGSLINGRGEIILRAQNALLDEALRGALPRHVQRIWDTINPSGRLSGTVRVLISQPGHWPHVDTTLDLAGQTSVRHSSFPYPVDNLIGRVFIRGSDVTIEQLRGSRGSMDCTVNGTVLGSNSDNREVKLDIEAKGLPLDSTLISAMGEPARSTMESLHASGAAEKLQLEIRQERGEELTYLAKASMAGVAFRAEAFPFPVSGAAGEVAVEPGMVTISGLDGQAGTAKVGISGQAMLSGKKIGLDMEIAADDLVFDDLLREAVPQSLKPLWAKLRPGGTADMVLTVRHNLPDRPGQTHYQVLLQPRDMQVRYAGFPYAFSGVNGRVVATPGLIEIERLSARHEGGTAELSGVIRWEEEASSVELSLEAHGLPIGRDLLSAMPAEVSALVDRFGEGGSCDVKLEQLRMHQGPPQQESFPVDQVSSAPGSKPATTTTRPAVWEASGNLTLNGAVINLDFGQRTASGTISGSAGQDADGLRINAEIDLDRLDLGRRRLKDLHGKLIKLSRGSIIRIDDIAVKIHGGRGAGFAEIRLTNPPGYGLSLSVENLQLADLFRSTLKDPNGEMDVEGLLTGNIRMTGEAGNDEGRQASGVLRISKGRIYKLPVMLGFAHIIYLWLPGNAAFTEGDVSYRLQGQKLIFDEVFLRGPAMSVVGSGNMDMRTEALNLTFLTGPPGQIPRLASLEDLFKGLMREVAEIRVKGTASKPIPQTVSLPGFDDTMRRMLNPERER